MHDLPWSSNYAEPGPNQNPNQNQTLTANIATETLKIKKLGSTLHILIYFLYPKCFIIMQGIAKKQQFLSATWNKKS